MNLLHSILLYMHLHQTFHGAQSFASSKSAAVFSRISSTLLFGLYFLKVKPFSWSTSKTAKSVTMVWTHLAPVIGKSQLFLILDFPYLSTWVWTTMTFVFCGFETRSCNHQLSSWVLTKLATIAPPIPFTIFPGIMKFAMSPY
jgi:hypothetical protein